MGTIEETRKRIVNLRRMDAFSKEAIKNDFLFMVGLIGCYANN